MPREVTFIQCNDMDFSYTSKARLHNGKVRRLNSLASSVRKPPVPMTSAVLKSEPCRHGNLGSKCASCYEERTAKILGEYHAQRQQGSHGSSLKVSTTGRQPQSLQGILSSYQRDLFNAYPVDLNTEDYNLTQYWFTIAEELFYIPKWSSASSVKGPLQAIFQTALSTKGAFECMILLPAAKHQQRRTTEFRATTSPDVYRHYAKAFTYFNEIVDHAFKHQELSFEDKMGCATLIFALANDGRPDALRAYKAVVAARVAVAEYLGKVHHNITSPLQGAFSEWVTDDDSTEANHSRLIGWTRVLTACDLWDYDESLQTPRAQKILKIRFHNVFDFLKEAQNLALIQARPSPSSTPTDDESPQYTRPSIAQNSSLYAILTCLSHLPPIEDSLPSTFKNFLYSAQTELLVYIHLHLISRKDSPEATHVFLDNLHAKAADSFNPTSPTGQPSPAEIFNPLRTMLWYMYSDPALHTKEVRTKANEWNLPLKYWQNGPRPWPVEYLVAWLVPDENDDGTVDMPLLDVDALKSEIWSKMDWPESADDVYEPPELEAFDVV